MGHNSTGWAHNGARIKVIKKTKANWLIDTADGKKWVDPKELALIPKVTNGLKTGKG